MRFSSLGSGSGGNGAVVAGPDGALLIDAGLSARQIVARLQQVGLEAHEEIHGLFSVSSFADGEINVQVHENVRGKDVYIIQPTCPPVNNNLMELLLMVSCLNRASAFKYVGKLLTHALANSIKLFTS